MTDALPAVDLDAIVNLAEFEPIARQRMTGPAYDYVAGGAGDEVTLHESVEAWRRFRFVPRVLRDVRTVDVGGRFLGRDTSLPVAARLSCHQMKLSCCHSAFLPTRISVRMGLLFASVIHIAM